MVTAQYFLLRALKAIFPFVRSKGIMKVPEADFMLEGRHLKITPLDTVELASITRSRIFPETNFTENNFSYLF